MTQVVKLLQDARNLIAKRENWTQQDFAKTADGSGVYSKSDEAVCWCSDGYRAEVLLYKLVKEKGFHGIPDFNDSPTTTHKDVIAFLDLALERAKALP